MASRRDSFSRIFQSRAGAAGLEIGTSAIKAVDLKPGNPPSLLALASRPTPAGLVEEDGVADGRGLAKEVKALFEEAGIGRRAVVIALSNRLAITRNLMVPKMPRKELDVAIRWEAERFLPYPLEEVVLDYEVLDDPARVAEGEQLEVVVAAARLDVVTRQLEALKLAGLRPVVVDIGAFALLRALRGALLGAQLDRGTLSGGAYTAGDTVVVLEVAASVTTLTLVRGKRLLMNRNLAVSGDDFTAALQRALGLDFDSAEARKLSYSEGHGRDKGEEGADLTVHDALRPVLHELTEEIRRSLEFFSAQADDAAISRLLVTGGGAKLRGLPEAVGEALGLEMALGDPWLTVIIDEKRFDARHLRRVGPEFGVPLGLALRGVLA